MNTIVQPPGPFNDVNHSQHLVYLPGACSTSVEERNALRIYVKPLRRMQGTLRMQQAVCPPGLKGTFIARVKRGFPSMLDLFT